MYHTVTFFERALRRCTNPSGKTSTSQSVSTDNVDMDASTATALPHPIVSHLTWMVPPLLKVKGGVSFLALKSGDSLL